MRILRIKYNLYGKFNNDEFWATIFINNKKINGQWTYSYVKDRVKDKKLLIWAEKWGYEKINNYG